MKSYITIIAFFILSYNYVSAEPTNITITLENAPQELISGSDSHNILFARGVYDCKFSVNESNIILKLKIIPEEIESNIQFIIDSNYLFELSIIISKNDIITEQTVDFNLRSVSKESDSDTFDIYEQVITSENTKTKYQFQL